MNKLILNILALLFSISIQAQDSLLYHILQSKQYIDKGKDSIALELLNKHSEEDYYRYFLKGKALFNLSKKEAAIKAFKKCSQLYPKYADLYISELYASLNQIDSMYFYLDSYLSFSDKIPYSKVYNKKAFKNRVESPRWISFWKKDYYTEEEKTLQQAIYYESNGEILTALDILDELINDNKKNAKAYYYRALYTVKLNKDYKGAIKDLQKALKIIPNNYNLNILLGKYYMQVFKNSKALNCFIKARQIFPYELENYYYLAEAYYREGDFKQTENYILYYLTVRPLDKKAILLAGNTYLDNQKNKKAIDILTKGVYQYPRDIRFVIVRGKAYIQNEEYQKAVRDFNTAIDLDAQKGELWFLKAMAYFYQEKMQEACKFWKKARYLNYYQSDEYLLKYCN